METHGITYHPRFSHSPPPPSAWTLIGRAVFDLVAAMVVGTVVALPLVALSMGGLDFGERAVGYMLVAIFAISQVTILIFGVRRIRLAKNAGEKMPPLFAGNVFMGILIGAAVGTVLFFAGQLYVQWAMQNFPMPEDPMGNIIQTMPLGLQIAIVAIIVIGAPVNEEIMFRGGMFGGFLATNRGWLGAFVSATLFALAHLNLVLLPFYLLFGLATAGLFAKTRSLTAPMVAHLVNNGVVMAILFSTF